MERLLDTIPYSRRAEVFESRPNVIRVDYRGIGIGDLSKVFASDGFVSCTAFILKGKTGLYGLFHAAPWQRLNRTEIFRLSSVAGGDAIQVKGSQNMANNSLRRELRRELGIRIVDTIQVDTSDDRSNWTFQVCYKPADQKVFVSRTSRDVLVFRA